MAIKIKDYGHIKLAGQLVRVGRLCKTPTGSSKVRILEDFKAYVAGSTLLVGPGQFIKEDAQ